MDVEKLVGAIENEGLDCYIRHCESAESVARLDRTLGALHLAYVGLYEAYEQRVKELAVMAGVEFDL